MTYPPPPGPDGTYPPPPDPPVQAYQPPEPYQPPPAPSFGYQGYGTKQPPPSPYAYPAPPYAPPRPTEGLAIASLAVSSAGILGLCMYGLGGLLGIVGAIIGHIARRRIRASGAGGSGMALAGIIIGWTLTGIAVLAIGALIVGLATDNSSSTF